MTAPSRVSSSSSYRLRFLSSHETSQASSTIRNSSASFRDVGVQLFRFFPERAFDLNQIGVLVAPRVL
jgi:hypothetical protein